MPPLRACEQGHKRGRRCVSSHACVSTIPTRSIYPLCASSACEKGQQWQQALLLLDRTFQDVITYNASISARKKGRQWEQSLALIAMMAQGCVRANAISCSAMISACQTGQQWDERFFLLDTMSLQRVATNVYCYSAAISACVSSFQAEQILATASGWVMYSSPLARI